MSSEKQVVEILAIGREILDGRVVDTNSSFIAQALHERGYVARFGQKVDDQIDRVVSAFEIAANRSEFIFVTGGLGPTSDDLTAEAFAKFLGVPLVLDPHSLEHIESFFKRVGKPLLKVQEKQAWLPQGCFALRNLEGTAPGFGLIAHGRHWFFMPGVPREMSRMLKEQVFPRLPERQPFLVQTWSTHFTSEGKLQEKLTNVEKKLPACFEMTYRTHFPENHVALYADCQTASERDLFHDLCKQVTSILGQEVYSIARPGEPPCSLEEVVIAQLKRQRYNLCTVESCTGGMIASRLTNVSGSSEVFWSTIVAYDNTAKHQLVGVPLELIEKHGAVSSEVAGELAENALKKLQSAVASGKTNVFRDPKGMICVSTTGIAGPGGGTAEKPVGLCYIGLAQSGKPLHVEELRARPGLDRAQNRTYFTQKALDLVRTRLLNC
ncbi:MAG: CinA family nicotinamide mononucleotide deamidase-related protein [Bdellovibrionota bacterium]